MEQKRAPDVLPESFKDGLAPNYLGNQELVTRLVSEYSAKVEEAINRLGAGETSPAEFVDSSVALVREYAGIFSGRDPRYLPIVGYHGQSLPMKLQADLGEFWRKRRSAWNDDAVCVLFEWLAMMLAEKMRTADGDDMLLGIMFKPSFQYAVQVLLGVEQRARPE